MRWSLRNQLLIPFGAILLLAVGSISVLSAVLAARNSSRQALQHLRTVTETLSQANFSLSEPVLKKMHALSGAHYVAFSGEGKLFATTLPPGVLADLPANVSAANLHADWESLDRSPLLLGETRYLIASVEPAANSSVQTLLVLFPEQSWSKIRRDAALPPLTVGLVAGLLTVVVAIWLSQRFGRRIVDLQSQVADIAAGDFRQILATSRSDELDELTASVNRMSAQLAQMRQTIRHSERTRLLTQLAGGLAHHLRNAVAGARMALQLHARRCRLAPAFESLTNATVDDQSLTVALRQLSLIETHLKGVLALGRLDQRPRQQHDLANLLQDIIQLVQPAGQHAGVELHTIGLERECFANIDVESVRAAVLNLLLNAIEAAGSRGRVELELISKPDDEVEVDQIIIEVRDTGPGPPVDVAETLLEPFVTTKPEGVGLGLALARQIASDHGGMLNWNRIGDQTCFRFVIRNVITSIQKNLGEAMPEVSSRPMTSALSQSSDHALSPS